MYIKRIHCTLERKKRSPKIYFVLGRTTQKARLLIKKMPLFVYRQSGYFSRSVTNWLCYSTWSAKLKQFRAIWGFCGFWSEALSIYTLYSSYIKKEHFGDVGASLFHAPFFSQNEFWWPPPPRFQGCWKAQSTFLFTLAAAVPYMPTNAYSNSAINIMA